MITQLRFLFFGFLKLAGYVFYPSRLTWVSPRPKGWKDVSLIIVLNHTSLFEFVFGVALPFRFLRQLSRRLVLPVASETLSKRVAGWIFKHISPKTIALSRKRDESWAAFLSQISNTDICIFMPEGRMRRRNGLDKDGKPMTVRGGVYDVLKKYADKKMVFVYSKGLHHVLAPGQRFPRVFRKIAATLEYVPVQDYLARFAASTDPVREICRDLELRRDRYCQA